DHDSAARAGRDQRHPDGAAGGPVGMRLLLGAGVLAAVLVTGAPAAPAPAARWAAPGESISTYTSRIDIRPDGPIRVTETIAYDFGGNNRHGILRRIPVVFRYDDTRDRVYPVDEVAVTM